MNMLRSTVETDKFSCISSCWKWHKPPLIELLSGSCELPCDCGRWSHKVFSWHITPLFELLSDGCESLCDCGIWGARSYKVFSLLGCCDCCDASKACLPRFSFFNKVRGISFLHLTHCTRVQISCIYLPLMGLTDIFNRLTIKLHVSVKADPLTSSKSKFLNSNSDVIGIWCSPAINSNLGTLIDMSRAGEINRDSRDSIKYKQNKQTEQITRAEQNRRLHRSQKTRAHWSAIIIAPAFVHAQSR